jgi:hypothetical protein
MYDTYIVRRTQIYLEVGQAVELARRAGHRGLTTSHVIREAIDDYLATPEDELRRRMDRYREALDSSFGVLPRLPRGGRYVDELRHRDARRARALDERRG